MTNKAVVVIGGMILLMLAAPIFAGAYEDAARATGAPVTVENETFTVQDDTRIVLDESNRDVVYDESVNVSQNGTAIEPLGNYSWNAGSGTLKIAKGTNMNTNTTANVTYGFAIPTQAQETAHEVSSIPITLGQGIALALGGILVVVVLGIAGGRR